MVDFIPLTVTDIKAETRNAVVITLDPPLEYKNHFKFTQGQYLTFRKTFSGEEVRRSYSICSGINDDQLRVAIKKVAGGWFSNWANAELKIGNKMDALPPNGRFFAPLEPEKSKRYLVFAIGSGITPILSLCKTILELEPQSEITLVYGNRSVNTIMFKSELSDLKSRFLQRFILLNVLAQGNGDVDILSGRIDNQKCDRLFATWIDIQSFDLAFICGPQEMMLSTSAKLQEYGLDKECIKFELFNSTLPTKMRPVPDASGINENRVKATIILDGISRHIDMPKTGMSVLEAAKQNDIDVPYSCQAGLCTTCSAKLMQGKVEMLANYGLEDYEVRRNLVLTCQSYPISDEIVINYDEQ